MASSTYSAYLFTFVIVSCIILGNKAALDVSKNLDDIVKQENSTDIAPVEMTLQSIENDARNCSVYDDCEDCIKSNCTWTLCMTTDYSCAEEPAEMCPEVDCSKPTTVTPSNDTTTVPPTTPDTEPPTTATEPPTTSTPTTNGTTAPTIPTSPSTAPTTVAPSPTTMAPHIRHFDAGSFVGGIILTLTLTAVSFAAWKFYRRRALSTNYTNF